MNKWQHAQYRLGVLGAAYQITYPLNTANIDLLGDMNLYTGEGGRGGGA